MSLLSFFIKKKASHLSIGEQGEKITIKEMKKMGVDVEKFKAAIKTLNMEGQLEATLKKMN